MVYALPLITLFVALLAALKDWAKKDKNGNPTVWRGIPRLTRGGTVVIALLFVFCALSIYQAASDSKKQDKLADDNTKLIRSVNALANQDKDFWDDQTKKHRADIDKFKEILDAEEKTGLEASKSIQRSAQQIHERLASELFEIKTFAVSMALEGLGHHLQNVTRDRFLTAYDSDAALKTIFCQDGEGSFDLNVKLSTDPYVNYNLHVRSEKGKCELEQILDMQSSKEGVEGAIQVRSIVTVGSDGLLYLTTFVPGSADTEYRAPHFLGEFNPGESISDFGSALIIGDSYADDLIPRTVGIVIRPVDPRVDIDSEWSLVCHKDPQQSNRFECEFNKSLPATMVKTRQHITSILDSMNKRGMVKF